MSITLKQGSRGPEVKELQGLLSKKGYSPGSADGIFGPKTTAAAIKFQRAHNLVPDGIVGAKTWQAIWKDPPYALPNWYVPPGEFLREGSRGEAVKALQQELKAKGYDPGPIDGIFGRRTRTALSQMQKANNIADTQGVAGPFTIGLLHNLGIA